MGHPILAIWVLGLIAILLSMDAGNRNKHKEVATTHSIETTQSDKADNHDAKNSGGETANEHLAATSPAESFAAEKIESTEKEDSTHDVSQDQVKKEDILAVMPVVTTVKTAEMVDTLKVAVGNAEQVAKEVIVKSATSTPLVTTVTTAKEIKKVEKTEIIPRAVQDKLQIVASTSVNAQGVTKKVASSNEGSELTQVNPSELLLMAREAYWNNGLDEAADLYNQLIILEPSIIEHKGELGNVYWRQGYPKKAAELYSEIALPMIEKGNSEKVANMVGFINLFYPKKAAEIQQKFMSMQNGSYRKK